MEKITDIEIIDSLINVIEYFIKKNNILNENKVKNFIIQYSLKELLLSEIISDKEYSDLSLKSVEKFKDGK